MPVKDVYGKEVSEQNHMILAHSPTSLLIQELKKRKMSDREIMEAKGLGSKPSIHNPELYTKTENIKVNYTSKPNLKFKHHPDAYKHQIISFIKSGIRILGYSLLIVNVPIAVTTLIFSEVIGIIEELV